VRVYDESVIQGGGCWETERSRDEGGGGSVSAACESAAGATPPTAAAHPNCNSISRSSDQQRARINPLTPYKQDRLTVMRT